MVESHVTATVDRLEEARAAFPIEGIKVQIAYVSNELIPAAQALFDETQSPDMREAVRKLILSRSALFHTLRFLDNADSRTTEWVDYVLGRQSGDDDDEKKKKPSARVKPLSITEKVDKYLGLLEDPWPKHKQLLGWRIAVGQKTDIPISSGKKDFDKNSEFYEAYKSAEARARELNYYANGDNFPLTGHIEIMEASTMTQGEKRIIVIGKEPCGHQYSRKAEWRFCHQTISEFLPFDATLIVYSPGRGGREYSRFVYKGESS